VKAWKICYVTWTRHSVQLQKLCTKLESEFCWSSTVLSIALTSGVLPGSLGAQ